MNIYKNIVLILIIWFRMDIKSYTTNIKEPIENQYNIYQLIG